MNSSFDHGSFNIFMFERHTFDKAPIESLVQIDNHHHAGFDGYAEQCDVADPDRNAEVVLQQPLQNEAPGRIASANCGSIWSQTFTFDPFGNINKTGNSSFNPSYSAATNRMTQIGSSTPTYDSNGNVTNDFLHTYAWDANGKPITIDGIGATYDALGRMVELNRSGVYGELVYAPTGDKLAVMSGQSLVKAFVPLTGGATAVYLSTGLAYYRHSDWLGSSRLATTPTQTMYGDVAYAPYGETYAQSGTADFSFTGMNEDVEQNANPATLYDFPAREYGIQGRWPSPDPAGLLAVDLGNPQSWNRYAYVLNNPLANTDPTGLFYPGVVLVNPADGGPCWVCDVVIGIFDFFDFLFSLFNAPPPPQAAPPPPGGYGAGIDPYGTWTEQVPAGVQVFPSSITGIPNGSGCTYGSGSCGGVIYGWTKDANGNIIGDFPGEQLCTLGPLGSCLYWNLSSSKWGPQDNAAKLATAVNKTGVQSLPNPCTVAGFYLGSAAVGASGGYAAGGEIVAPVNGAVAPYLPHIASALYQEAASGFTTILELGTKAANGMQKACNAVQ